MKKIHFIIMVIALLFSGCTTEEVETPAAGEKMVKIRVSTVNPPEIVGTRTMLDENFEVKWHKGDEVFMVAFYPDYNGIMTGKLTNVCEDGYEALFEGEVPEAWLSNTKRETVFYSYKSSEWSAANGVTLTEWDWGTSVKNATLPAEQPLVPGTFARHYNLSAATFELNDDVSQVYFHNLCGLLRVSLKGNARIKSLEITAPSKMNGIFTLKSNAMVGRSTVYTVELQEKGSSDAVTLLSEEGLDLNAEPQSFYACVLPENIKVGSVENAGPSAGEYTVSVTTVEGKVVTKTISVDKGIAAGRYTDLGEMEVNFTFLDTDGTTYDIDPSGMETVDLYYVPSYGELVVDAPDWLEYQLAEDEGKISFSADAYLSTLSRSGTITITQGETSADFTVSQDGLYLDFADQDLEMDPEGVETAELPYAVSLSDAEITVPEWLTYTVDEAGSRILFSADAYVSGTPRTGEIVISKGTDSAVLAVSQKGIALVSLSNVYSDAAAHEGYVIEKSAFFTEEYTLVEELDWLTASKDGSGNIVLSVDANGTGAVRTGAVLMKVGESVGQIINVTQTTFNYSSFLGNYKIDCKLMDNSVGTSDWPKVQQNTSDVDYILYFEPQSWQRYYIVAEYVPIGSGCISLACPQVSLMKDKTYPDYGTWVPALHAARRHSNPDFLLTVDNYKEIDAAEGCGFDLIPVIEDGSLKGFDFVPNAKAQELYPEGLDGIYLPEYRVTEKDGANQVLAYDTEISNGRILSYFRALEGQEYLRMTKK